MTPERAKYLLNNPNPSYGELRYAFRRPCCTFADNAVFPDGITREEDKQIRQLWKQLPGWSSYRYVLEKIAGL